jgi:hypothetical protein
MESDKDKAVVAPRATPGNIYGGRTFDVIYGRSQTSIYVRTYDVIMGRSFDVIYGRPF